MNAEITRRGFVKAGGALFVSIGVAPKLSWAAWDAVAPSDLVTEIGRASCRERV